MTTRPSIVQTYEVNLRALMDLYEAHLRQHPDFDECGGVGTCLLMRAEVDAEQAIERSLRAMAASGIRLRIGEAGP